MRLAHLDIAGAVCFLVFSVWMIALALGYGIGGINVTGSGFFPLIAGTIILICSIGVLFDRTTRRAFEDDRLSLSQLAPVAGITLATAALIASLPWGGLVPLTMLYVPAVSYCVERPTSLRGHVAIWCLGVIAALASYYLFDVVLEIPLPWGTWEN